jgi:hypothetical protein
MLMQNDKIRYIIRSTRPCELFYNVAASIYSMRVWEDKAHFLKEKLKIKNWGPGPPKW